MLVPQTPSFRLDGRRALVTGASRGIGFALAASLAQAGAQVTLCARTAATLQAATAAIRAQGGDADALVLDVTDAGATKQAIGALQPVDILVNCAGTNRPSPFLEVSETDFDELIHLNVRAAFFVAQAVAARMVAAGIAGSIINISSTASLIPDPGTMVYGSSKAAFSRATQSLATELGAFNIRVNAIAPGVTRTNMFDQMADSARDNLINRSALKRPAEPQDIANAALFLASELSAFITGQVIRVDGGVF